MVELENKMVKYHAVYALGVNLDLQAKFEPSIKVPSLADEIQRTSRLIEMASSMTGFTAVEDDRSFC